MTELLCREFLMADLIEQRPEKSQKKKKWDGQQTTKKTRSTLEEETV